MKICVTLLTERKLGRDKYVSTRPIFFLPFKTINNNYILYFTCCKGDAKYLMIVKYNTIVIRSK